ncbi:MAG: hypothetical protein RL322_1954 [Pseudomonadota bacterium]|jgi:glycerol-3-phosphate dehydrogenase
MTVPSTLAGRRAAALATLARPEGFDLAVVGGGASGLAVALQAARAGRSVALVEAFDFTSGTSSRSTKLLHGGVRYLGQGQIKLVREALGERARLLALAPALARPLRFVMPAYRWWEQPVYGLGLKLYDWLAGHASLGATRTVGRDETIRRYPQLNPNRLRGAVSYSDAQFDDCGLAIAMARGAQEAGAVLVNRVLAQAMSRCEDGRMRVALVDRETGAQIELTAGDVVNATGVWVDQLRGGAPMVQPSQGAHIVVGRHFFPFDEALLLPRTADGRVLFVVPWLGHCVIGTTDTPRDARDLALGQESLPFSDEIDLILDEVSRVLRPAPRRADILSAWAGLRPLVRPDAGAGQAGPTRRLSREHAIEIGPEGLVSMTGGKWTSCLAMADDVLEQLPNRPLLHHPGDETPLPADAPDCSARVPTPAEVKWLAEQTWARTVEDVLARRSRLMFLDLRAAIEAAPAIAETLEGETGCTADLAGFMLTAQAWLARFRP